MLPVESRKASHMPSPDDMNVVSFMVLFLSRSCIKSRDNVVRESHWCWTSESTEL